MSSRVNSLIATGILCLVLLPGCGPPNDPATPRAGADDDDTSKPPEKVLQRIEKYKAPAFPKGSGFGAETYDLRKKSGAPVPSSLIQTFACDIWRLLKGTLRMRDLTPKKVAPKHVLLALAEYTQDKWQSIGGYRPWTHRSFVRSLRDREVPVLAAELAKHIADKGAKDPMRPDKGKACTSSCSISCRQPAGSSTTFLACAQVCKVDSASPGKKPYKTCARCVCKADKPQCECVAPSGPGSRPKPRPRP